MFERKARIPSWRGDDAHGKERFIEVTRCSDCHESGAYCGGKRPYWHECYPQGIRFHHEGQATEEIDPGCPYLTDSRVRKFLRKRIEKRQLFGAIFPHGKKFVTRCKYCPGKTKNEVETICIMGVKRDAKLIDVGGVLFAEGSFVLFLEDSAPPRDCPLERKLFRTCDDCIHSISDWTGSNPIELTLKCGYDWKKREIEWVRWDRENENDPLRPIVELGFRIPEWCQMLREFNDLIEWEVK